MTKEKWSDHMDELMEDRYLDPLGKKDVQIDWARIGRAVEFYKSIGYDYVEVPWIIDPEYREITYLGDIGFTTLYGDLVGSAEQSFIAMHLAGQKRYHQESPFIHRQGYSTNRISGGSKDNFRGFVACTPCFRDHQPKDWQHMPYFMKVELFSLSSNSVDARNPAALMWDAGKFFRSEGAHVVKQKTEQGLDWFVGELEVGSYGKRKLPGPENKDYLDTYWVYGTGLAEPRFSLALKEQEKDFERGLTRDYGDMSKYFPTKVQVVEDKD